MKNRPDRDPFLEELWEDRASQERGDSSETGLMENAKRAIDIYARLEEVGEQAGRQDAVAGRLFLNIKKSILNYLAAIDRLSATRLHWSEKGNDRDVVETADLSRRRAHDTLIDDLNIFSRYCVKAKLDTGWKMMLGSGREEITDWALKVGPYLSKRSLE